MKYRSHALPRHLFTSACALLGALSMGSCGRINFDPLAVGEDGDVVDAATLIDAATPIDADVRTDARNFVDATPTTASFAFISSTSCTGPDNQVLVPVGGIAQGATLVVQVVRRVDSGSITITDPGGNLYTEFEASSNSGIKTTLFQSTLTTALAAGEFIEVAESNPAASVVIITELAGANPNAFSSQIAGADDANISIGFTATSPGVVLCAGGTRDGDVVMTDNWDELALVKDNCGGNGELTAFGYWIPAGRDGLSSCEATLQSNGGFLKWAGLVRSYGE